MAEDALLATCRHNLNQFQGGEPVSGAIKLAQGRSWRAVMINGCLSIARMARPVFVGMVLLGGVFGCERKACEVIIVNESPSVGLAQRYFVELMKSVNLASAAGGDDSHAWSVVIQEAMPVRGGGYLDNEWVDFKVVSPGTIGPKERCDIDFDACMKKIVGSLPRECRRK